MREAPLWFQSELARIGGLNHYGEPIFRLSWSPSERMTIAWTTGYRDVRAVQGEPCWALMIWEPAAMFGSPVHWDYDYRDEETGLLQCGGFPKYGKYRLLQKFIHREMVNGQMVSYRMEPCGFMLDIMLPLIKMWLRLTDAAKRVALQQEEQIRKDEFTKKVKDLRSSIRVRRGSALVQKRVEVMEKGMKEAMRIAAKSGLGMRMEA